MWRGLLIHKWKIFLTWSFRTTVVHVNSCPLFRKLSVISECDFYSWFASICIIYDCTVLDGKDESKVLWLLFRMWWIRFFCLVEVSFSKTMTINSPVTGVLSVWSRFEVFTDCLVSRSKNHGVRIYTAPSVNSFPRCHFQFLILFVFYPYNSSFYYAPLLVKNFRYLLSECLLTFIIILPSSFKGFYLSKRLLSSLFCFSLSTFYPLFFVLLIS